MENANENIQALNLLLAKQIATKDTISQTILTALLKNCSEKGLSLGQVLLQQNYLNTTQLASFMRSIHDYKTTHTMANRPVASEITTERFGDYLILGEIARGGMGIVYRARQIGVDRIVALKILLTGPMSDDVQIHRFFREAKVIAGLDHPNVIPLYAMGEYEGQHFFTMKYVQGGTFSELLEKQGLLKEKLVIIAKICLALNHVHEHKVLHRDLKPSNILLGRDNNPYLTDFGLAKVVDSKSALTQTGNILGTPFYMSPEQTSGNKRRIDRRSDIYSMGVILYQALTGKLPFNADVLPELYLKINHENPVAPHKVDPSIAKSLEAICLMAMEKSPEFRYQNAKFMADDLENFFAKRKIYARRVKIKARLARFYRGNRKKVRFGVTAGALLVLIAVIGYWLYQSGETKKNFDIKANLQAIEICERAEKMFSAGQRNEALDILRRKSKKQKHYRLYLELANCYRRLERLNDARHAYEQAFILAPLQQQVLYEKSEFHRQVGEYTKALKLINAYLKAAPKSSVGYRRRAEILQRTGERLRAQKDTVKANELEKRQWEKRLQEAKWCDEQGQKKLALSRVSELLAKHTQYESGYLVRAKLYKSLGNYNQALSDISQAIELNPRYHYRKQKGHWLQQAGYLKEARDFFEELLPEANGYERQEFLSCMGDISLKLKEYSQAYRYYIAITLNTKVTGEMRIRLGQSALEIGQLETARENLEKARDDTSLPNKLRGEACFYMGRLYQKQKNQKCAHKMLEKAIALNAPQADRACLLLGREYLRLEKYQLALEYLKRAAQTYGQNAQLHRELGDCYVKLGNFKGAVAAFSVCSSLEPWNSDYHYQRAMAYSALAQYAQAQHDLVISMYLSPENSKAMVQLFENMFKDNIVGNYPKMRWFLTNYVYFVNNAAKPDLFATQWEKLSSECIRQALLAQEDDSIQTHWNSQEAKALINALVHSKSLSVHQMVYTGLVTMYRSPEVRALLAKALRDKKYLESAKRRLRKLENELSQKYLSELKVKFRHLLVRYYRGHDVKAIDCMYEVGEIRKRCLASMLADESENAMLRFLAAQALCDLKTRACRQILVRNTNQGLAIAKLFSAVALSRDSGHPFTLPEKCFQGSLSLKSPYARAIAALYMPLKQRKALAKLLKDPNLRVRLCAAKRLYQIGDRNAEQELYKGISLMDDPTARAYSLALYWNFSSLQKHLPSHKYQKLCQRVQKQMPILIKATRSKNHRVRKMALLTLAKVGNKAQIPIIAERLQDKNSQIRFVAIHELSKRMESHYIVPLIVDAKQPLAYRVTIMNGISEFCKKNSQDVPANVLLQIMPIFHDPDPRVRLLMIVAMSKIKRSGGGVNFLKSYVEQNKSDPEILAGYLLAVIGDTKGATQTSISYLKRFFTHQDPRIKSLAIACTIYVALKQKSSELSGLHRQFLQGNIEMRKAAAMGYEKLLDDQLIQKVELTREQKQFFDLDKLYRQTIDSLADKAKQSPQKAKEFSRLLSAAIELDPDNVKYRFERGVVRCVSGNYAQSIADLKKATNVGQSDLYEKVWLARAYFFHGDYWQALEVMEQIPHFVRLSPRLSQMKSKALQATGHDRADWWKKHALFLKGE